MHFDFEKKEIQFDDNVKECINTDIEIDVKKRCNAGKSTRFFDKIAWLKLNNIRKNEIAQQIINDSSPTKLYWIQLFLSCIIVAL